MLWTGLALWNGLVFLLYGIDKKRAMTDQWRISEKTLLLCAFLMGSVGAFFGMRVFRHKTKHLTFQILVPVAVVLHFALLYQLQ